MKEQEHKKVGESDRNEETGVSDKDSSETSKNLKEETTEISSSSPISSSSKSGVISNYVKHFRVNKSIGLPGGIIALLIIVIAGTIAIVTGCAIFIFLTGRRKKSKRRFEDTANIRLQKKNGFLMFNIIQ